MAGRGAVASSVPLKGRGDQDEDGEECDGLPGDVAPDQGEHDKANRHAENEGEDVSGHRRQFFVFQPYRT